MKVYKSPGFPPESLNLGKPTPEEKAYEDMLRLEAHLAGLTFMEYATIIAKVQGKYDG